MCHAVIRGLEVDRHVALREWARFCRSWAKFDQLGEHQGPLRTALIGGELLAGPISIGLLGAHFYWAAWWAWKREHTRALERWWERALGHCWWPKFAPCTCGDEGRGCLPAWRTNVHGDWPRGVQDPPWSAEVALGWFFCAFFHLLIF